MTMFVHASARLARVRREAERRSEKESPRIWARVVPPNAKPGAIVYRADWLTPYTAQTIAEDAVRSGPGAQLEVSVPPDLSDADLAAFHDQLASLDGRDISVRVRRDRGVPRPAQLLRPDAA